MKSEAQKKSIKEYQMRHRAAGLCIQCQEKAVEGKSRCQHHLDLLKKYTKAKKKRRVKAGVCFKCGGDLDSESNLCAKCRKPHRKRTNLYKSERRKALRIDIIKHYGAKCNCCGEDKLPFLTIDHVNGGGNEQRRTLDGSARHSTFVYKFIVDNNFPPDIQILCWNCNCGRSINGGVCPHEEDRAAV